MNEKILVVEDDAGISRFLSLELKHEGYDPMVVSDGRHALDMALEHDFGLILLDVMLPSLNGIEVLRRLRQTKDTPVIILTARDQVIDKVMGLDLGASDYMTKPFAIEELLARIRVNIKKVSKSSSASHSIGKLKLDVSSRTAMYGDDEIILTKKEFDLLDYLVQNKNIVLSRDKIIDNVWNYDFYGETNVVDVCIRYIRAKIDDVYNVEIIKTVRGAGYVIREEENK